MADEIQADEVKTDKAQTENPEAPADPGGETPAGDTPESDTPEGDGLSDTPDEDDADGGDSAGYVMNPDAELTPDHNGVLRTAHTVNDLARPYTEGGITTNPKDMEPGTNAAGETASETDPDQLPEPEKDGGPVEENQPPAPENARGQDNNTEATPDGSDVKPGQGDHDGKIGK